MTEIIDSRYVDCEVHGPNRRAYIVCNHILDKRDPKLIAFHKPWTDDPKDGCGELCCSFGGDGHQPDDLSLMCEDTLLESGILQPSERRLT